MKCSVKSVKLDGGANHMFENEKSILIPLESMIAIENSRLF